jgi:hypothetical protein
MEMTRLGVAVAARDINALLAQRVPDAPNLRLNARRYPIIHNRIFRYGYRVFRLSMMVVARVITAISLAVFVKNPIIRL